MRRHITAAAARALDRGVAGTLRWTGRRGRPPRAVAHPGRALRELAAVARDYPSDAGDAFYRVPRLIEPTQQRLRPITGGTLYALRWPADLQPFRPGARLGTDRHNCVAAARLWAHEQGPRPVVVLVHGYGTGSWRVEQRLWPIRSLYRAGLDVAQFVLPYHGVRADPRRRGGPPFPSANPRRTLEGFRQAVSDLRELLLWLAERGHPRVGLLGMSLGAYVSALTATVQPGISALGLLIPLASLADYARETGALARGAVGEAQHHALERAYGLIDPLGRAPLVSAGRTRIVAGAHDRITPPNHARRLAAHFGCEIDWWPGGHLLQVGRTAAFDGVQRFLCEALIEAPRSGR